MGDKVVAYLDGWYPFSQLHLEIFKGIIYISLMASLLYLAIKYQQQSLIKSERQYKELFYSNPTPLWIYDRQTLQFLDVNDAAIRQYGYSKSDFRKMSVLDIRDEGDHGKVIDAAKNMTDDFKLSGKWQHVKRDGTKITVQISSHKIGFEGRDCVMVMAQDVTRQIQQDEKLQRLYSTEKVLKEELERNMELMRHSMVENQKLAEVIDRIYNMVVITDTYGRISWVNQAFVDFTGYQLHEIEGTTLDFLHGPETDEDLQRKIMEALHVNDFAVFEVLNYTKLGVQYWVELTISGVYNDQNEVVRYISIQNIITERKQSEEKLQQQNKILRKISWTNSHAIRKPVASIISLVELSKEMSDVEELKAIHGLIGICSLELDEITKEVSKMMSDMNVKE